MQLTVAEELNAEFESIRVVNAVNGRREGRNIDGNPALGGFSQLTDGLNSTKRFWGSFRVVAA